jgi:mono/diheme cytochrome c family protein
VSARGHAARALRAVLLGAFLLPLAVVAGSCGADRDAPRGNPVSGERLAESVEPACGRCHVLERAGWEGEIGPSLDELRPGYGRVLEALRSGPGLMPAYGQLSDAERHDIAAFVSRAATEP